MHAHRIAPSQDNPDWIGTSRGDDDVQDLGGRELIVCRAVTTAASPVTDTERTCDNSGSRGIRRHAGLDAITYHSGGLALGRSRA